jgi:hypothetical protein
VEQGSTHASAALAEETLTILRHRAEKALLTRRLPGLESFVSQITREL